MLMGVLYQDGLSKSLNVLGVMFSAAIFGSVLFFKVEAWAQKQRTETIIEVTQMEWEYSLSHKTALKILQDQEG